MWRRGAPQGNHLRNGLKTFERWIRCMLRPLNCELRRFATFSQGNAQEEPLSGWFQATSVCVAALCKSNVTCNLTPVTSAGGEGVVHSRIWWLSRHFKIKTSSLH